MTAALRGWGLGPLTVVVVIWAAAVLADTTARPALLTVVSDTTTTVLDTQTGQVTAAVAGGVSSPSGDVVVSARPRRDDTTVSAVSSATGAPLWSRTVEGAHDVRLVGPDSTTVVLGPSAADAAIYVPQPRETTTLTLSRDGGVQRTYRLPGNYEPEALSLDGTQLFVISYVPPEAPKQYQVRRLELATGTVHPVFSVDSELQQAMGGTARTQLHTVNRLYTLYTVDNGSHTSTFVHVLALDRLWAHCVDLPGGLGADEQTTALTASPDGSSLFVADVGAGRVAEIDTAALSVRRVVHFAGGPDDEAAPVTALAAGGGLVVGNGDQVSLFAGPDLAPAGRWQVRGPVVGLQSRGRQVLAVLQHGGVAVLDRGSPSPVAVIRVPGAGAIQGVRGTNQQGRAASEALECAC